MAIYKRGGMYWTDFTVGTRRYRIPLKTSRKQEATNLEKLRIAEAQKPGGLLARKTAKLSISDAGQVYFTRRESEVSASTMRLERDAFKQVKRHIGSSLLGILSPDSIVDYVRLRKAEKIANRTINIEVGVVRRILKQFRLWHVVGENYKPLPESKNIGRVLAPEQELKLFTLPSSRPEWSVVFWISLVAANTTAGGVELRNLRFRDIDIPTRTLFVKVGKNQFRVRSIPLNQTALWAVEQLMSRAQKLGSTSPEHYLIPSRVKGKEYDPTQPPSRWGWRTAWRKLTESCGLGGLRPHDLRHHAITKLAESSEASEQTIMSIAGHVSREMLEHYSHIRQEAKRKAVASLDNVTITSQLGKWKNEAEERDKAKALNTRVKMVGMGRFELPTPRTPSECSTRLSHIPTIYGAGAPKG